MFIINQHGRVVGLPESMEEAGLKQAKTVLSISDSLWEMGEYTKPSARGYLNSKSGRHLRDMIFERFPDVIRDSEYIEKFINKKEEVNFENTKNESIRNTKTTKVSGTRQKNR